MPRELLLRRDRAPRDQALARDEPAGERENAEGEQRLRGPVVRDRTVRRDRSARAVGPRAEQPEELEQPDDPGPESQTAPVCAEGRAERDVSPPAAGEEVNCCCQEGQQTGKEDELDRPAADQARAEIEIARGALRELEPLVECPECVLRRSAHLSAGPRAGPPR